MNLRIPCNFEVSLQKAKHSSELQNPPGRYDRRDTQLHEGTTATGKDDPGPVQWIA